jgi:outer membrane receptor protein involved in Fe transport
LAIGGVAVAQQPSAAGAAAGQSPVEEVLVTGSRIVRRDLNAPSPILTVDEQLFQQTSSVSVEGVLNQYPQFNPGATQFTTGEIQPTATTSPGASTLDMRGLGPSRSLVLIDGRRAQPINAGMVVDVNTIPSAAIESVEVISGGAAATYGPDAMAGVVNFKLKDDFQGISIDLQTGDTWAGDGATKQLSVLMGGNFADGRGNAMITLGYADREAAWQLNRDFYMEGFNDPGTRPTYPRIDYPYYTPDSSNRPSQAVVDQVLGIPALSPGADFYVNPQDGTVFRREYLSSYTGPTTFPYKVYDGALSEGSPRSYASTPLTRRSAFARTTYDLTDNLSLFAQGTFVLTNVSTVLFPTPLTNFMVPRNPALEPQELRMLLDSRPDPNADYALSRLAYWYPNRASTNDTTLDEFVFGFNGKLPNTDWTWTAYASYGKTTLLTDMKSFVRLSSYGELLAQPNFGRGGSITREAANSNNSQTFTCTSGLPIFEPWILQGAQGTVHYSSGFQISDDCLTAVTARLTQVNSVEQRIGEIDFQGKIADIWSGELRGAFGISTRKNSSAFEPDDEFLATTPAVGETNVDELYGEILLPIVKRFDLELGARYSDFTTGDASAVKAKSYKALFNWTAMDSLRFRGGWQRANRTPNVAELYSGPTAQVVSFPGGDICRSDTRNSWGNAPGNPNRAMVQQLCADIIYRSGGVPNQNVFDVDRDNFPFDGTTEYPFLRMNSAGNPNLTPEVADTYTAGLVWQAGGPDLTVSTDWYSIDIDNVVALLRGSSAVLLYYQQCFNADGKSNPTYSVDNVYCRAIERDPDDGTPSVVNGGYFNLSKRRTSGIDVSVNWRRPLEKVGGTLGINSSVNYLLNWEQPESEQPDSPLLDYAGAGEDLRYRLFTQLSYNRDQLSLGLNWRYLPETKYVDVITDPNDTTLPTDAYSVFNLNGAWTFADRFRLRGGIDNVFDTDPPVVGADPFNRRLPDNSLGYTNAGLYDTLGRRYYLALSVDF